MSDLSTLHVAGASPYDVVVGTGLLGELPRMLGEGVQRVARIGSSTAMMASAMRVSAEGRASR